MERLFGWLCLPSGLKHACCTSNVMLFDYVVSLRGSVPFFFSLNTIGLCVFTTGFVGQSIFHEQSEPTSNVDVVAHRTKSKPWGVLDCQLKLQVSYFLLSINPLLISIFHVSQEHLICMDVCWASVLFLLVTEHFVHTLQPRKQFGFHLWTRVIEEGMKMLDSNKAILVQFSRLEIL